VFLCNKTRNVNTPGKELPSENAVERNPRPSYADSYLPAGKMIKQGVLFKTRSSIFEKSGNK
jgi:hypothetical protein